MIAEPTATTQYPFHFETEGSEQTNGDLTLASLKSRGRFPSIQTSKVRSMILEAHDDPSKIVAHVCSYDSLSSRVCEEAGIPVIFLSGYAVAAAAGLPDAGYIAFPEMVDKIQEAVRVTTIPIIADGDTGYGSPMNVRRTV
jgi:2-methylisocitrate lyase-like PEP mutase family enzyme